MGEWLQAEQLAQHYQLFHQHKITGKALAELKRIHSLQQFSFFNQICTEMGISEIGDRLRLSSALLNL